MGNKEQRTKLNHRGGNQDMYFDLCCQVQLAPFPDRIVPPNTRVLHNNSEACHSATVQSLTNELRASREMQQETLKRRDFLSFKEGTRMVR